MTKEQKIIKYVAKTLAILLIIGIFYSLFSFTIGLSNIFDRPNESSTDNRYEYSLLNSYLDIDLTMTELNIYKGDKFLVETDSKYINTKQDGNKIIIKEKKTPLRDKRKYSLNITIPEDLILDVVNINTASGKINIQKLSTKYLDLDLGAGSIKIDYLKVTDEATISSGAGKIAISSGIINEMDLDMGTGNTKINASLTGDNEINCGVGKLELNLLDNIETYTLNIDKGIGSITLNNKDISNGSIIGNGPNKVSIDGAVGNIIIKTN